MQQTNYKGSWLIFGLKAVGISVGAIFTVGTAPIWATIYVSILGWIVNRKALGETGRITTLDGRPIDGPKTCFEEELSFVGVMPWGTFLFPWGGLFAIYFAIRSTFTFIGHIFTKAFTT